MTLLDLLAALANRGVKLSIGDTGRLRTSAPPGSITADLADAIRVHHDHLVWAVVGRDTGHYWTPCNKCGEVLLIAVAPRLAGKVVWPACHMTPGCKGRHVADANHAQGTAA